MVQKEPEALQLIKTWWLNTVGFSTIKQIIIAEQFIYCWGHSALWQQTDPSTSGGKACFWPSPIFCSKHFNVNQCRTTLVSTSSQRFRDLNMIQAALCPIRWWTKDHALKGTHLHSCFFPLHTKENKSNFKNNLRKHFEGKKYDWCCWLVDTCSFYTLCLMIGIRNTK